MKLPSAVKTGRVRRIEYVGEAEAWNISMAKNHNFLLGNGILTHNTQEAQASLRRMMERYASMCRFILSCNYSSRVIPPIQSRCAVFRFRPLKQEEMTRYLERIATGEGKTVDPGAFEAILHLSMGDMRQAVNILQQASSASDRVTADGVYESSSLPMPREVEAMLQPAIKGDFRTARERLITLLTEKGASGEDVLKATHAYLQNLSIPDSDKIRLVDYLAEIEFRMVSGASSRIQLEALLAKLASQHRT